jgi:hypothetical protein
MKNSGILLVVIFFLGITDCFGQGSFQRNRKAFQRMQFSKTTTKYGKACEIFHKRNGKSARRPLINLRFGRRSKAKQAEQD